MGKDSHEDGANIYKYCITYTNRMCICKICSGSAIKIFKGRVLNKYVVNYYKCIKCGFIQTEDPFWLKEAYSNAIANQDVGLVHRNLQVSTTVGAIVMQHYNYKAKFLDYAGGYGLFVRIMRDKGFDFYWKDSYCQNIFAQHFVAMEIGEERNTK